MTDKTIQLKLLTVPEVAEMLSISESHVYALKATGKLKLVVQFATNAPILNGS